MFFHEKIVIPVYIHVSLKYFILKHIQNQIIHLYHLLVQLGLLTIEKILYPLTRKIPDDFKILVIIHSWRCWSFLLVLMRNVLWICICFIYIFLVYVMIQWELHFKFFFCYLCIIFFLC